MPIWTAYIGNDPNDDYNLIIEVQCDDKDVAVIRNINDEIVLRWYPQECETDIPVDWLVGLLTMAKESLRREKNS